jgi:hypothetical protein
MAMPARLYATAAALLILSAAQSVSASDRCTISYDIEASLQVTDTYLKKGNIIAKGLEGSIVIEYPKDRDGRVADGKVKVLHFAVFQKFSIHAIVNVTTTLHHFAPTCNGPLAPTWRRPSDKGFPNKCGYTGNERAVAVGKLSKRQKTILWTRCKAADSYWAKDRKAYTLADESRGRGCLNELHVVGNVHCEGRLACKWGGLERGDNPQSDVWTQPLIHGPPGSESSVEISVDLRTIRTPTGRHDGFLSYNLPNDSPSRTWLSWVATRDDDSPHTTCPEP